MTQPIEMRVNEMVSGVRADVAIKLFGYDLEVLRAQAAEIEGTLYGVKGAADISVEQTTGQPALRVVADTESAARLGVSTADNRACP